MKVKLAGILVGALLLAVPFVLDKTPAVRTRRARRPK